MFELIKALQQSSLSFLTDVHHWALLPTSFHCNIAKDYVVLQHLPILVNTPGNG